MGNENQRRFTRTAYVAALLLLGLWAAPLAVHADGGSGPSTYGPPPTPPIPAGGDDQDDPPRRDIHMGTVDHMRMGRDDQGNIVMESAPRPKNPDQQPQVGPFFIYPQVGIGQGPRPMPGQMQGQIGRQGQPGRNIPMGGQPGQTGQWGMSGGQGGQRGQSTVLGTPGQTSFSGSQQMGQQGGASMGNMGGQGVYSPSARSLGGQTGQQNQGLSFGGQQQQGQGASFGSQQGTMNQGMSFGGQQPTTAMPQTSVPTGDASQSE